MPVRLKDIAESLKLSISTVSAALHNRPDISPATRDRVLRKASELNYRPNSLARGLVTHKTHILGIVVPDLSRSFFTEVTSGVDSVVSEAGYNLLLSNTQEDAEREMHAIATLISRRVDGLIIASAQPPGATAVWKRLAEQRIPLVLVDRYFPRTSFVGGDDERIGYLATAHLIEEGYRRIAHLSGPQRIPTAQGRMRGYLAALKGTGLNRRKAYIIEAQYHEEASGYEAMQKLLRLPERPDAVFAASDPIAIGALQAILNFGLRPPVEMGLIGVGNHRYGRYLRVPLSTVDQRRLEIGKTAAKLLLSAISDGSPHPRAPILIEPEVVVRESSSRGFSVPVDFGLDRTGGFRSTRGGSHSALAASQLTVLR